MELTITTLLPTVGHIPVSGTDANGRTYTEWELGDGASFVVTLPSTYVTGESIVIVQTESSTSTAKNHKWRFTMATGIYSEQYNASYTSNAVASTIDTRSIIITSDGTVEAYELQAGDVVSVTITRVAADSLEDSASIRVYTIVCNVTTVAGAITACLGRVGSIVQRVLTLFNDDDQRFINDARVIMGINECQRQIALTGYFTKSTDIDIVAAQQTYALGTLIPDIEAVISMKWNGDDTSDQVFSERLVPITTMQAYQDAFSQNMSGTRPYYYLVDGFTLYLCPVPSASVSNGISVYHSYVPADLGCTSNYTPSTPASHDATYVYFSLMEAYARDRHSPMAMEQLQRYMGLFGKELNRLTGTRFHPGDRLRSYR